MIRIALVEDDAGDRALIQDYLRQYEQNSGMKFHLRVFSDGEEIAEDYRAEYDLILLDIEMKYMDGMTAAERIRQVDPDVTLIFITNMPQFAMNGYRVNALDYMLKPVTYFAFSQRLAKALVRMDQRRDKYIIIPQKGGLQKVSVSRIRYVEVFDHDLVFHTTQGDITAKGAMRDVEEQLGEGFFRCNKCYLLNLDHVDSVQGNDVKVGEDVIQVSRARRKALMDALNDFISEVGK